MDLDLADAFKKIVQEKIAAEAILKASTPLEDLGDVDALEAHLQNMSSKNEVTRVSSLFYPAVPKKSTRPLHVLIR